MSSNQVPSDRVYSSERNKQICEFYLDSHTQTDTALKFGISAARVYQILREEEVPPRKTRLPRRKLIDTKSISAYHAQIGQDISYRRHKLNMRPLEFATAAGFSKERLRAIELGVADATVSELAKVCKVLGVEIQVLTKPRTIDNLSGAA